MARDLATGMCSQGETLVQVGFLVGASLLILVLSFEGALYWVRLLV